MIRNFIYLDEEKMYSLSSQLFEGVTEYVLSESISETENSEAQKGPVGSGRILGDILKRSDRYSEKKFLNDYSYTIFEKKLLDDEKVVTPASFNEVIKSLCNGKTFLKITSKAIFNDMNAIKLTLDNFNKIGKALAHVTNHTDISNVKEQLENLKDKNQKRKLQAGMDIKQLAKKSGLYQDETFLKDLALLLTYGFQDQLEIQMKLENAVVSANLNRSFLRESEELVIRKYSRHTEVDFTLFGIVTQYQRENPEGRENTHDTNHEELDSIKKALMNLVIQLTNLEGTFTGRLSNEIIIDPIALYTEI